MFERIARTQGSENCDVKLKNSLTDVIKFFGGAGAKKNCKNTKWTHVCVYGMDISALLQPSLSLCNLTTFSRLGEMIWCFKLTLCFHMPRYS